MKVVIDTNIVVSAVIRDWLPERVLDTQIVHTDIHIEFPRDRKDAPFLECAESVGADYFITGDSDLSEAQSMVTTRIISASQFEKEIMQL